MGGKQEEKKNLSPKIQNYSLDCSVIPSAQLTQIVKEAPLLLTEVDCGPKEEEEEKKSGPRLSINTKPPQNTEEPFIGPRKATQMEIELSSEICTSGGAQQRI
jgi:hypothetical protein